MSHPSVVHFVVTSVIRQASQRPIPKRTNSTQSPQGLFSPSAAEDDWELDGGVVSGVATDTMGLSVFRPPVVDTFVVPGAGEVGFGMVRLELPSLGVTMWVFVWLLDVAEVVD